jgi:hypothetical protein
MNTLIFLLALTNLNNGQISNDCQVKCFNINYIDIELTKHHGHIKSNDIFIDNDYINNDYLYNYNITMEKCYHLCDNKQKYIFIDRDGDHYKVKNIIYFQNDEYLTNYTTTKTTYNTVKTTTLKLSNKTVTVKYVQENITTTPIPLTKKPTIYEQTYKPTNTTGKIITNVTFETRTMYIFIVLFSISFIINIISIYYCCKNNYQKKKLIKRLNAPHLNIYSENIGFHY